MFATQNSIESYKLDQCEGKRVYVEYHFQSKLILHTLDKKFLSYNPPVQEQGSLVPALWLEDFN
jgi:catalase